MNTATQYGDISPEVAGYISGQLLERGAPTIVLDRFGQADSLPSNKTKTMTFFRYNALPSGPENTKLQEGVQPGGRKLSRTPVTVTLNQYGDFIGITDVVEDTCDDSTIQGGLDVLSQQINETSEKIIIAELLSTTSKWFANGAVMSAVNTVITKAGIERAVTGLMRQNAKFITKAVKATVDFGTEAVRPAYIAIIPPELVPTVRAMDGFKDSVDYGAMTPYPTEIGAVNDVRFLYHTLISPYAGQGATGGTNVRQDAASGKADVFPIIIFGDNAYANVALNGMHNVTPWVRNPKSAPGDELGQTGSMGWKFMKASKILNDAFLTVIYSAAPV